MKKVYVTKESLQDYIETKLKPSLLLIGTNLTNKSKCNQMAARQLGYASYESLQPMLKAEEFIATGLYYAPCKHQENLKTFKAKNIILVLDDVEDVLLIKVIAENEETIKVTEMGACQLINFPGLSLDFSDLKVDINKSEAGDVQALFKFSGVDKNGLSVKFDCNVLRTHEGVILDVYEEEGAHYGTLGVCFDDEENEELVDQYKALFAETLNSIDGDFYQWLMRCADDEGGVRYLPIKPNEGMPYSLSELLFPTVEKSKESLETGIAGYTYSDLEGLDIVLVNVKKTIAHPLI